MVSAGLALALLLSSATLVFGVQEVAQRRRTGRSSWVDPRRKGRVERVADTLFLAATALVTLSPVLVLVGALEPAFAAWPVQAGGALLIAGSAVAARWAQRAMGAAWRTGVGDEDAGTLVEDGPFASVRNPVYSTIVAASTGAAALAPTLVAAAGVLTFVVALQIQVRAVEEPHLRRLHGDRYGAYASRAGRFVPGIGRLR